MDSVAVLTIFHVALSLVAIGSGFLVMLGMLVSKTLPSWTRLFLATTTFTSVTGFFFPYKGVTPGIILGVLSLLLLAPAYFAFYNRKLAGKWAATYVITALVAQYFDVLVLITQSFQKIPQLKALAPTQSEAPFAITQIVVLLFFIGFGFLAVKMFRPNMAPAQGAAPSAA